MPRGNSLAGVVRAPDRLGFHRNQPPPRRFCDRRGRRADRGGRRRALRARDLRSGRRGADAARVSRTRAAPGRHPARRRRARAWRTMPRPSSIRAATCTRAPTIAGTSPACWCARAAAAYDAARADAMSETLYPISVEVNGVKRTARCRRGSRSSTGCARICASPARTSAASTASAARARSCSTASRCAPA